MGTLLLLVLGVAAVSGHCYQLGSGSTPPSSWDNPSPDEYHRFSAEYMVSLINSRYRDLFLSYLINSV